MLSVPSRPDEIFPLWCRDRHHVHRSSWMLAHVRDLYAPNFITLKYFDNTARDYGERDQGEGTGMAQDGRDEESIP